MRERTPPVRHVLTRGAKRRRLVLVTLRVSLRLRSASHPTLAASAGPRAKWRRGRRDRSHHRKPKVSEKPKPEFRPHPLQGAGGEAGHQHHPLSPTGPGDRPRGRAPPPFSLHLFPERTRPRACGRLSPSKSRPSGAARRHRCISVFAVAGARPRPGRSKAAGPSRREDEHHGRHRAQPRGGARARAR